MTAALDSSIIYLLKAVSITAAAIFCLDSGAVGATPLALKWAALHLDSADCEEVPVCTCSLPSPSRLHLRLNNNWMD